MSITASLSNAIHEPIDHFTSIRANTLTTPTTSTTSTTRTTPGVVEVVISGNKCFGANVSLYPNGKPKSDHGTRHEPDRDQSGWIALCEAMKGSNIQKLGFADIGIGPIGMKTLADAIPTIPGLTEVVLSGNPSIVKADIDLLKQARSRFTITI